MLMKKVLAALVFVGFLTGGVAAPIGLDFTGDGVTVSKAAHAQAAKPEEKGKKQGKEAKPKKKDAKKKETKKKEKQPKKGAKKDSKDKKEKKGKAPAKKTEG